MILKLTPSSTCRGIADWHASARYYVAGPVQAGNGKRKSIVERDVAARACCAEEQIVECSSKSDQRFPRNKGIIYLLTTLTIRSLSDPLPLVPKSSSLIHQNHRRTPRSAKRSAPAPHSSHRQQESPSFRSQHRSSSPPRPSPP